MMPPPPPPRAGSGGGGLLVLMSAVVAAVLVAVVRTRVGRVLAVGLAVVWLVGAYVGDAAQMVVFDVGVVAFVVWLVVRCVRRAVRSSTGRGCGPVWPRR
jgi:hypothetical protein